jgi:type IV pilus assembly protein PilN
MRRVNLLPAEERRRRAAPTTTRGGILGVLLIVGALFLLVMVGLYLYYYIQLGNEEEQIAQLDQDISRQQARVQELAPFQDLQARLDAKKPIADGIFRTRFSWDEFLRGLAFVIPEATALDVFTGTATPINFQAPSGGTPDVQNLEPPGTITFSGFAQPDYQNRSDGFARPRYQNISDFIVRMNSFRFLANASLTSAELDREIPPQGAVEFEVSADLVTRVGENGEEVPIGIEEDGEEEGDKDEPPGSRASRPGAER